MIRPLRLLAVPVVALGVLLPVGLPGAGASQGAVAVDAAAKGGAARAGAEDDLAAARAALSGATDARMRAEARLAAARAEQTSIRAELEELSAGAERITEDLAAARTEMREYVVAASIDGGASTLASTALSPRERASVAWHNQIVGSATAEANEAIERFNTLKELNDPARVSASARLADADRAVQEALDAAVQAAAHERDAEAAVASASARADAERAAQAASAAEAARSAARDAGAARRRREHRPSRHEHGWVDGPAAPAGGYADCCTAGPGAALRGAPGNRCGVGDARAHPIL
ncbi:MAG: hypothetical protein R2716_02895 [Microthrixaceae bacterium]